MYDIDIASGPQCSFLNRHDEAQRPFVRKHSVGALRRTIYLNSTSGTALLAITYKWISHAVRLAFWLSVPALVASAASTMRPSHTAPYACLISSQRTYTSLKKGFLYQA
jgi:hypothetical protein